MSHQFATTTQHTYNAVNVCIYCNSSDIRMLTNEHIIPYGLGGRLILPKSSCADCSKITCAFEGHCLVNKFGDARFYLNIKSRKRNIPDSFDVEITDTAGNNYIKTTLRHDLPAVLFMFHFNWLPKILHNISPTEEFAGKICIKPLRQDFNSCINKLGGKLNLTKGFGALPFGKMLAKIAHSYATAELGRDNFKPFLPNLIRGIPPLYPSQFIGGSIIKEPIGKELHEIRIEYREDRSKKKFIVVRIHLFASFDMPVHYVVVGEPLTH